MASNDNGQLIMAVLGLGAQYGVLLPYSRTHESEADFIGLRLVDKIGGQKPPEFMSTHPSDETRIGELSSNMKKANKLYQKALGQGLGVRCKKP